MIEQLLLDIFGGNEYHAQAEVSSRGKGMYYKLVEKPLDSDSIRRHLDGEVCLGSYPVEAGSNLVKYVAWDIDSLGNLEDARKIAHKIIGNISHLPYAVSFSGNKGYHIYLFFDSPVQAQIAKQIAEEIRDRENLPRSGNPHVECYPKQARLVKTGSDKPTGNLLKIPLGIHPITHNQSIFVDPKNGFENGIPLIPEEVLKYRITEEELVGLREVSRVNLETLAAAIAVEWDDGRRHDICLYLSGYLAQMGWTYEYVIQLIDLILKNRRDDSDVANRRQAVKDTFKRFNRGAAVAGFQSLSEVISGGLMKTISEQSPILISPNIARQIDSIRFDKGATWKKERDVASLIWNWLTDSENGGRILRVDPTGLRQEWKIFYFDTEKKNLLSMESALFDDILYRKFNVSMSEGFTQRVKGFLIRKARTQGHTIRLNKQSLFLNGKLYVNLGGTEIHVLDGKDITVMDNGDENIYFLTNNPTQVIPRVNKDVDVWKELIDSISFETSKEAPMKPEEQKELLKAWVLAYFFREMLPTRPILSLLGLPGSGKTTAIRQILRTVEGLGQNVSGIVGDREDAWRSMLEHKSFIVLDNIEEVKSKWLSTNLDLVATGELIQIRQLYTTNEMYSIRPDVFVALTAVDLPFSKDTVYERMLVLNMQKLTRFTPSHVIEKRLHDLIPDIWGDLLLKLNEVVQVLNTEEMPRMAMEVRMADFANFCTWISSVSFMNKKNIEMGLKYLSTAQQVALAFSDNSVYPLLLDWVEKDPVAASKWRKMGEIYEILRTQSKNSGKNFYWKSVQALGRHMNAMRTALEQSVGLDIQEYYNSNKGRTELNYRFIPFGEEVYSVDLPEGPDMDGTRINLERGS